MLPIDDDDVDIETATGLKWEDLLPVLLKANLIKGISKAGKKSYQVDTNGWSYLKATIDTKKSLDWTTARRFKGDNQHFFVVGKPFHRTPLIQQTELKAGRFSFDTKPGVNTILSRRISEIAMAIQTKQALEREKEYEQQMEEAMQKHPMCVPLTIITEIEQQIQFAFALNLSSSQRLNRQGSGEIAIHMRKQANESDRQHVVHLATYWGYRDPNLTANERMRISVAACRQVAYDRGFQKPLAHTQVSKWFCCLDSSLKEGKKLDPLSPSILGKKSYVQKIEENHPGYLHELFRYATRTKGANASFGELAKQMNLKSNVPGEMHPTLTIRRRMLSKWFDDNGGKLKAPVEKPLLTPKHMQQRVDWVHKYKYILSDDTKPVAFLDEKWFYTSSRRRRRKILPRGPNEPEGADIVPIKKVRSRRHPVKAMFLGVVARPQRDKNFDGKIHIKRVSHMKKLLQMSRRTSYSDDAYVQAELKQGLWHNLHVADMTFNELADAIISHYSLEEHVAARLEFVYKSSNARKSLKMGWKLENQTFKQNGTQHTLTINDVNLFVRYESGDEVMEDVNCDSKYMLDAMDHEALVTLAMLVSKAQH